MTRISRWIMLAPATLLWTFGVLIPLAFILRMSLYSSGPTTGEHRFDVLFYEPNTFTFDSFVTLFTQPYYQRLILFTIGLAIVITVVTMLVGYLLAYSVFQVRPAMKPLLLLLIVLPKFTNILVFIFGLKVIFGPSGFWPVVAGEVLVLFPYAALTIAAALESVPKSLIDAARGLGAKPSLAFWNVTFRLSLPGTLAAATMILLWSLSAFLGPYLLGKPEHFTLAVEVERKVNTDLNWPLGAAMNVVLLAMSACVGYLLTRSRLRAE